MELVGNDPVKYQAVRRITIEEYLDMLELKVKKDKDGNKRK